MASTEHVVPLAVGDEKFLVASTIERCPKIMMIRELTMNAFEAAQLAEGRRLVVFSSVQFDGVPKLAIWNSGPWMNASELFEMCDLASSIGKEKSLDGNFGMGAKVASLPSNQFGLRYRSCKAGKVHEVILCKRGGAYGRLQRYDPETDTHVEVVDVTPLALKGGESVDEDWTEVILLGNDPKQNTVKDPYNGDPAVDAQWLATYLYHRFYRLPPNVKALMEPGTHKLDGTRQFEPISGRLKFFEKSETVEVPQSGIKIHYLYDAPYEKAPGHNKSISGALQSAVSTCSIIYRDEMYDVRKGREWTLDAPIFGIPFGGRHISVHIELPSDFKVRPEGYRQFLRYMEGEQAQVEVEHFSALVREHRPEWLIEVIRSFSPEGASNEEIRDELQKLLQELNILKNLPLRSPNGSAGAGPGKEPGKEPIRVGRNQGSGERPQLHSTNLSILPSGARRANVLQGLERVPEIILLRADQEIEDKEMKGRAARYYSDTSQLFINMQYPALADMRAILEREYAGAPDPEAMRLLVNQSAERSIILSVGRAVVFALAKQLNKEWDTKAVATALSPESLSLAADDFLDGLQSARRRIGVALRSGNQREVASSQTNVASPF